MPSQRRRRPSRGKLETFDAEREFRRKLELILTACVDRPIDPGVLEPIGASVGAGTTRLISFG